MADAATNDEKTASAAARPSQYQLAAGVAKHVELRDVRLQALSAALKVPFARAAELLNAEKTDAKVSVTPTYNFNEAELVLTVLVEFQISVVSTEPDGAELLALGAGFELTYGLDSAPPAEPREMLFNAFAHLNGMYNAWPYLRELVQNTTSRMTLPPVVLPVFRVGPEAAASAPKAPKPEPAGAAS